jgi:hypothetical protein
LVARKKAFIFAVINKQIIFLKEINFDYATGYIPSSFCDEAGVRPVCERM